MPNAGGSGYYIFGLDPTALKALVSAREQLTSAERIAVAHSIASAQSAGRLSYSAALEAAMPFAETTDWRLLRSPLELLEFARERIVSETTRPNVEKVAAQMLSRTKAAQPPAEASDPEAQLMLRSALAGEIDVAQLPAARQAAKIAGLQFIRGQSAPEQPLAKTLLQPTFIDLALNTTLEDVPAESFEATVARLRKATDPVERRNLLTAIGYSKGPYAAKARALIFDPAVRTSEIRWILEPQSSRIETRDETWQWFVANYDPLLKRVSEGMAGGFPWLAGAFCTDERATEVEQFFAPRIATLRGGPRNLAAVLEHIRTCAANVKANKEDAQRYFDSVRE
jgi:alanyl aminopeptidase